MKVSKKNDEIKVGIGIMIFKNGKILLGKRKGSHGEGEYAFPGGHLEYMESVKEGALRELEEECDIKIKNLRFQFVANVRKYKPKHYVHFGMVADWKSGEPKVLEPEKMESWNWYGLDKLPKPMFEFCKLAVKSHKTKNKYFDNL